MKMNLLLFFLLTRVVIVIPQSTVLDSQCDYGCRNYIEMINLDSKCHMLETKFKQLDQQLQSQAFTILRLQTDISQLKLKSPMTTDESTGINISDQGISFVTSSSQDCEDIRAQGHQTSGVYGVDGGNDDIKAVFCEMTEDDGTWTHIMRRQDNLTDFTHKNWTDYEAGFGDPRGSYWIGLIRMHHLTSSRRYKLRVDLTDWDVNTLYAQYSVFRVGPAWDKYRLTIRGYNGTAGDSMVSDLFSTADVDNDAWAGHCAAEFTGGWWYGPECSPSKLTGTYFADGKSFSRQQGIYWDTWHGDDYSFKIATMKIQRRQP